jgi:hypothetical protein
METIKLEHHVLQILIISNRDKCIEILTWELILDANLVGAADGGELGVEVGEAHGAVNGENLGFAVEVRQLVVMRPGLNPTAITDHELDPSGDGGGGRKDFIGGVVVVTTVLGIDLAASRRGVAGVGVGGVGVALHPPNFLEFRFFGRGWGRGEENCGGEKRVLRDL